MRPLSAPSASTPSFSAARTALLLGPTSTLSNRPPTSLSHDPSSLPLNLNKKKPFYFSFPHPKNMARLSIAALLFALLALVAGAAFAHRELQSEFPFFLFSFFLALSLFLLRR